MDREVLHQKMLDILRKELVTATGCTEPIAIALAGAKARAVLGDLPESVEVFVSEAVMKNAKSVIVPNTHQLKGIKAAVSAGIVAGDADKALDVITNVSNDDKVMISSYLNSVEITVTPLESDDVLDIIVVAKHKEDYTKVRIAHEHSMIVYIEKNAQVLLDLPVPKMYEDDDSELSIRAIYDFALSVNIEEVQDVLDRQIEMNKAISEEGLKHSYGANIGSVLMEAYGDRIENRAKAKAAAASDARMGGAKLPVTIVSGSGNQGISVSIPVIEYAKHLNVSRETLYRALILSNLITIHQKSGIGCLSAYCGAVFSGAASGAGIAFLHGGDYETITHTIVNALAIVSGMICDGAKPSCAAKIATAVDAGILGYHMYLAGEEFLAGDGILAKGVEKTLKNVARLVREGMKLTNQEILKIMAESES